MSPMTAWVATPKSVCVYAVGQTLTLIARRSVDVQKVFVLLIAHFRGDTHRVIDERVPPAHDLLWTVPGRTQ